MGISLRRGAFRGRTRFARLRRMRGRAVLGTTFVFIIALAAAISSGQSPKHSARGSASRSEHSGPPPHTAPDDLWAMQGRRIFRYDTFGDEAFWSGNLRLQETVAGLTPKQALGLGLKVDADSLPPRLRSQLRRGEVDLDDPTTTLALLRLDAVVGVAGGFTPDGQELRSVGVTCALCHSTVDDSLAPGVGRRLDGWANRDLDIGAIIASAPDLSPFSALLGVPQNTVRDVLRTWGPGKFDPALVLDGKAFRPDGKPGAVLIPPAFGLAGVELATVTGWGSISYWNNFVAVLEMRGQGSFLDPRLADPQRFPIAAANGFFSITRSPDLVTPKLPALRAYQHSIKPPRAPAGSFDASRAVRGGRLFLGKAKCATCHAPPLFTEPGVVLHAPEAIGIDNFQANRSPTGGYRTTPLRGLWTHADGGFYHDGRFETLEAVVEHYDEHFNLNLTEREVGDLVEYLKSL